MLRGQTGIRNLKRVEHTQLDQRREIRQRTGRSDEPDQTLIPKIGQEVNQPLTLQSLRIATVELQNVYIICANRWRLVSRFRRMTSGFQT